jgi:hypothetical protein
LYGTQAVFLQLHSKLKNIAASTVMVLMAGACTENFEELNANPMLLTEDMVQPPTLFTSVLKNSIYETFNPGRIHEFAGYYGNQATGNILSVSNYTWPFNNYRTHIMMLAREPACRSAAEAFQPEDAVVTACLK